MGFFVREAEEKDLRALFELYAYLHGNPFPEINDEITKLWGRIRSAPGSHVLLGCDGGKPVSTCFAVVIENLTRSQRPYMLIENVVTRPEFRGKGYASAVLGRAKEIASEAGCYKIMLLTGSKEESILNFYRKSGYNSEDKTAFIQWL